MTHDDTDAIIATLKMFSLTGVFEEAPLLCKLAMLISGAMIAAALIVAIGRRMSNGRRSGLLAKLGLTGLLAGLAGALYDGLLTITTMQATHTTRFVIVLPEVMEMSCILGMGLVAWTVAIMGNAGAKR